VLSQTLTPFALASPRLLECAIELLLLAPREFPLLSAATICEVGRARRWAASGPTRAVWRLSAPGC